MGLSPVAVTKTFRIKSLFIGLSAGRSLNVYMWALWQRFSQSLLGYSSIQYLEYFEQHFSECRISLAFFVWKISFVATSDVCRYCFWTMNCLFLLLPYTFTGKVEPVFVFLFTFYVFIVVKFYLFWLMFWICFLYLRFVHTQPSSLSSV